jgi:guanylate kinase
VWRPVPATTRPRRDGEVDGVDRVFLTPTAFDRLIAAGGLLEWSRAGPHRRGTPYDPLRARLAAGQPALLPLDIPGALAVRERLTDARLVLLRPPNHRPDPAVAAAFELVLTHDLTDRVADELVGLLGSSYPTPAGPRVRG